MVFRGAPLLLLRIFSLLCGYQRWHGIWFRLRPAPGEPGAEDVITLFFRRKLSPLYPCLRYFPKSRQPGHKTLVFAPSTVTYGTRLE